MSPPRRALLYACFVASGAAGLILEIVWSKYLSLLLGNSIYGVSTVVAAFLGGLGIGAAVGGRIAARSHEPLAVYARLEMIIGALGLVSPLAYLAARPLFASLYGALGGGGALFLGVRFLILFAVMLAPTVAMGATLPLLASDFTRRGAGFESSVGRLYAFNTAGAVVGVAAAGFVLIPRLGLWKTAALAALLDFGVAAVVLRRRPAPPPALDPAVEAERSGARPEQPGSPPFARLIVPLFALSGFTAILYEIAWTRILSVPLGGMVYALSAILALYLLGLALGSAAAVRVLRRWPRPVLLFGMLQIALGVSVAAGAHLFGWIPHLQTSLIIASGTSATKLFAGEAGIAALVVLLPTILLGALFPMAAAIYQAGRREAGSSVGVIYAANTAGSIAGSLLTGFVLIPWIGSRAAFGGSGVLGAILAASAVNLAIGLIALLAAEPPPRRRLIAAGVVVAAVVPLALFARPTWPAQKMSLGFTRLLRAYRYPRDASRGARLAHDFIESSGTTDGPEKLRFYREGRLASVAVVESASRMALIVNGKPDATTGSGEDMMTQILLGQLPLLVGRDPKDVCIVGYGSGVTTHSVLTHPVREALTIELEQAVIDAKDFFRDGAFDPLSDPRSRLLIEDAGTFLRSTSRKFDVIISEPSNPWIAGVGDLFTKEFYEQAASRLSPDGIFCQWVQCYEISPETLATIFRTLVTRFPRGQVFYFPPSNDLVIVASPDRELSLDIGVLERAFARPEVARDLARVGIGSLADLLRYYRGRLERLARDMGPGSVNTDDNGWLEHRAPLDLLVPPRPGEPLAWGVAAGQDLAASLSGPGADRARASALLLQAVDRAVAVSDLSSARGLAAAAGALGGPDAPRAVEALRALEGRAADIGRARTILNEATLLVARASEKGDAALGEQAVGMLEEAVRLDPNNGEIHWRLGVAMIPARKTDGAVRELRRALGLLPATQHFAVRRDLVVAQFARKNWQECLVELAELDRIRPGSSEARYWRARVYHEQGDRARAQAELAQGLRDYPNDGSILSLRAMLAR